MFCTRPESALRRYISCRTTWFCVTFLLQLLNVCKRQSLGYKNAQSGRRRAISAASAIFRVEILRFCVFFCHACFDIEGDCIWSLVVYNTVFIYTHWWYMTLDARFGDIWHWWIVTLVLILKVIVYDFKWDMTLDFYIHIGCIWHWMLYTNWWYMTLDVRFGDIWHWWIVTPVLILKVIVYDFGWDMTLYFYIDIGCIWHWMSALVIYVTGELLHLFWYWKWFYMIFGGILHCVLYTDFYHWFWYRTGWDIQLSYLCCMFVQVTSDFDIGMSGIYYCENLRYIQCCVWFWVS